MGKVWKVSPYYTSHYQETAIFTLIPHASHFRERDHWGDPDIDWRIILGGIFRKWEGIVGTGWSRLRTGTGGGHL
jgi:hypothetical protein